jgi:DNA-directed RNA polymerase specialized sigma24 family protein
MRRATPGRDQIADSSAAFAEWVSPHLAVMASLAARLASDGERDDVVQEALLRAWKKQSQYDARRGDHVADQLACTRNEADGRLAES